MSGLNISPMAFIQMFAVALVYIWGEGQREGMHMQMIISWRTSQRSRITYSVFFLKKIDQSWAELFYPIST